MQPFVLVIISTLLLSMNGLVNFAFGASDTVNSAVIKLTNPNMREVQETIRQLTAIGDEAIEPVLNIGYHPTERKITALKPARQALENIGFAKVVDHLISQIRDGEATQQQLAAHYLNSLFFHPVNINADMTDDEKESAISDWLVWWESNKYRFIPIPRE